MQHSRSVIFAAGLIFGMGTASAQDLSRYRAYVLESSLGAVLASSGARPTDTKTLHERPAVIQELQWRAPYLGSRDTQADPVRSITFSFYNDALYQVTVSYDRSRTEGLTDLDIIESISATYGMPVLATTGALTAPVEMIRADNILLAQWEHPDTLVSLLRSSYVPEFQLIVSSKRLVTLARSAIAESVRLDGVEAPARAAAQRKREADDASASRNKTRSTNKGAFRP
jgi:hypothetical protein